jgi:hypothetical protein
VFVLDHPELTGRCAMRPPQWPSAMPTVAQCHAHSGPVPCPQWPSAVS